MDYQWDPRKAADNLAKHSVDFADAVMALEDDNALTIADQDADELRFKTLGMGPWLNVLYVVHAERGGDCIRIISARTASKREMKQYSRGLEDYG
jgi:uncharacterized DUF497 family protein